MFTKPLVLIAGYFCIVYGATDEACNFPCSQIQQPVCGTDNRQYTNLCELSKVTCKNHSIVLRNPGACPNSRHCPVACSLDYSPVCGSDGSSYPSECWLQVASCQSGVDISVVSCDRGPHQPDDCPKVCSDIYNPVCGSNGLTYTNECILKLNSCELAVNITVVSTGTCTTRTTTPTPPKSCPRCSTLFNPVCGSDGRTYTNECLLSLNACQQRVNITVASQGSCGTSTSRSPIVCPRCSAVYNPVCGSDGQTYNNECVLKLTACQSGHNITIVSTGICRVQQVCPPLCSSVYNPVCGSDGRTYVNECVLKLTACRSNQLVTVSYHGICGGESCQRYCVNIFQPVCGTDNKTYGNSCLLEAATCQSRGQIRRRKEGIC